jgi:RecA/RadA recombinase
MFLNEYKDYGSFYTGFLSLDYYLEGIPRGYLLEFSGRESSYKTTLVQQIFGTVQKKYPDVRYLYIDTEGNITKDYFEACGGNSATTEFLQENLSEEVLDYVHEFIIKNNADEVTSLVAVDSIAGFTTAHEVKQGITKATMGDVPKIFNRFLRLTAIPLKKYGSTVIFNNQLRDNLSSQFGGTTTPGGRGVKHWFKYRVSMYDLSSESKMSTLNSDEVSHPVSFVIEKGKNLTVYKGFTFTMDVILGKGFSRELDLINFGTNNGYIELKGHFYTLPNGEKFSSKNNLYDYLIGNADLIQNLYDEMLCPIKNITEKSVVGVESD